MNLEILLEDVRERYIDRFRAFVDRQKAGCIVGGQIEQGSQQRHHDQQG
jgi:hypothetical protein